MSYLGSEGRGARHGPPQCEGNKGQEGGVRLLRRKEKAIRGEGRPVYSSLFSLWPLWSGILNGRTV